MAKNSNIKSNRNFEPTADSGVSSKENMPIIMKNDAQKKMPVKAMRYKGKLGTIFGNCSCISSDETCNIPKLVGIYT